MTLKELRKKANLTQKDLARKLGYEQTIVSMWENGTREPNVQTLIDLAKIFNCSIDELLDYVPTNKKQPETIELESKEKLTDEQTWCIETLKTMPREEVDKIYYFMLGLTGQSLDSLKRD